MKLIVGLGNPGKKYTKTKHNIGFMSLDAYAGVNEIKYKRSIKFTAEIAKTHNLILLKPKTFMNNSGLSVRKVCKYYDISPEDVMVISDDTNLPFSKIRLRQIGSAGGHNGIKSIIDHLNTQNFNRLRVGIGKETNKILSDYVLSEFSKNELKDISDLLIKLNEIIDRYSKEDKFENLMNTYNTKG